jgi:hypothetical protein
MSLIWNTKQGLAGREYIASNGARVYAYPRRPFQPREWGVQLPNWNKGDGGFRSMAEAKSFAEKHS